MDISFRLETPDDHYAVEEMTRDAFWHFWEDGKKICDEHYLVHKLRSSKAFVPELNYLAEIEGELVGHIIFTKSWIEADDGKTYETLTFGPLTVAPEYQSRGIGRALMQHTFEEARKLGYRAVIIFGHPDYYPRVGFQHAIKLGISPPEGEAGDAFLVYTLYEGALDGIRGKYFIDDVYMQLTQEEALEFDKRFPPKKAHTTTPIDVLLKRLEPDAVKGLKGKGFKTLDVLKSQSEREVLSIPGMDDEAIEKVRNIMREYNFPWGEL